MMKRISVFSIMAMIAVLSCMAQRSRIVTDTVYSKILDAPRAYTAYLPPSFDKEPERHYPVLYLLHGLWGNNNDWVNSAMLEKIANLLVRSGEADEMIIVTPDADTGMGHQWQCGYFNVPGWNYEDFFFTEFIPEVEKRYRVIGDKRHRAVAGLSMGGGGTAVYAQKHPDMFAAAYPMSGLLSMGDMTPDPEKNDKQTILSRSVIENDCIRFVTEADDSRKEALRSVDWYIDCGDDDFLLDCNLAFYQAMRDAGIPAQLRVRDGIHDWDYWTSALYTCLPFVSRAFAE